MKASHVPVRTQEALFGINKSASYIQALLAKRAKRGTLANSWLLWDTCWHYSANFLLWWQRWLSPSSLQ